MQLNIFKQYVESLRLFAIENYGAKIKPSHAHEIMAAFFGYRSKNALLADKKYPINNLQQAEIVVLPDDEFVEQRQDNLEGLLSELPDIKTLGDAIYESFISDEWWSVYPPYRSFKTLAKDLIENNDAYQSVFKFYRDVPMHHFIEVKREEDDVLVTVIHSHQASTEEIIGDGQTTINLPRVAGRIGYGKPKVSVESWAGGARRVIKPVGVQL